MKKLIYGGFVLALCLVACNKQDLSQHAIEHNEKQALTQKTGSYELSQSEIEQIGLIHNQTLTSAFDGQVVLDINQLKNYFLQINLENSDFIKNELNSGNISNFDYTYLETNLADEISLSYISEAKTKVMNAENHHGIAQELLSIKSTVQADDRNFNKTVVLLFIEVAQQSSNYWSNGMTGIGEDGYDEYQPISDWTKGLIAADGLGAAGAFTSYGLLAAVTGPMSWGALVATVGFAAAWSSGSYALTS